MFETAREMERDWPNYQVWYVKRAVGPTTWHARRWDDPVDAPRTLDATSAAELVEQLVAEAQK